MADIANTLFGYVLVCAFGLAFGSFLNVVIYRLPIIEEREWRRAARELLEAEALPDDDGKPFGVGEGSEEARAARAAEAEGRSATVAAGKEKEEKEKEKGKEEKEEKFTLLHPASHCPKCKAKIGIFSNVPVFSWLVQKGKCRHCGQPISFRYPLIELLTAVMIMLVFWSHGFTTQALGGVVFTLMLICLMAIDAEKMLLLDVLTLPLLWIGLLLNMYGLYGIDLKDAVLGAFWGYMSLWIVNWLFELATGKQGMGNGDFKLLAALGAWMGYKVLLLIVVMSCVVGIVVSVANRIRKGQEMPFGPYLGMAGWLIFVFRDEFDRLIAWWLGASGF